MKNKKILIGLLTLAILSNYANALPMFQKQTGLDCKACHMQQMPKLNALGRSFMLSGMTMSQNVADMNANQYDINPSLLIKAKYEKSWDKPSKSGVIQTKEDTTNDGIWSLPRTAAVYLGGRINENAGALLRVAHRKDHDKSISGKAVFAKEMENGYLGTAFYSTSNFGPFSGMEIYNTGLYKPLRSFEGRTLVNATQASTIGTGPATGIQIYFDTNSLFGETDHLFGTVGIYAPAQDNLYLKVTGNVLHFARIAYEFPIGDYNMILGGFSITGGETTDANSPLKVKRETYGMDLQLEGEILHKSISLIATKVFRNKVDYTGIHAGLIKDIESLHNDAFSLEGQIMITPDVGLKLSYLTYDDKYEYTNSKHLNVGDIDHAITAGLEYNFVAYVPMKFSIEYTWVKPELERVEDYNYALFTLTIPL